MAKKQGGEKLIFLLQEETSKHLERIFERLTKDDELRERFANDPVEVLRELGSDIPADTDIGLANRVIFHLMGEDGFIAWSHRYHEKLRSQYAGEPIVVNDEIVKEIAKDTDEAIRDHLPPKLTEEYTQKFASPAMFTISPTLLPVVVFNPIAIINMVALWNVFASVDHMTGLDIGVNELVRAALLLLVSVKVSAAGVPVGVGVRVGGGKAWGGPDG